MNQVQIKNDLVNRLQTSNDSIKMTISSLGDMLSSWNKVLEGTKKVEIIGDSDLQSLLSFMAYQDETLHNLGKSMGQVYFILATDLMQESVKEIEEAKKPKLVK